MRGVVCIFFPPAVVWPDVEVLRSKLGFLRFVCLLCIIVSPSCGVFSLPSVLAGIFLSLELRLASGTVSTSSVTGSFSQSVCNAGTFPSENERLDSRRVVVANGWLGGECDSSEG